MAARAMFHWRPDTYRTRDLIYRSLQLNPNSAIAMATAAQIEASMEHPKKALEYLVHAERLSPRDPRGWYITWVMSLAYFMDGQFAEAATAAKKFLNQNPRSTLAQRLLAARRATKRPPGGGRPCVARFVTPAQSNGSTFTTEAL
jgi:predicted Zn-dependent protease